MNEEKKQKGITKEEYYRILNLPIKTMSVAGGEKSGRYDDENKLFYEMNSEGKLTGRVAHLDMPKPIPDEIPDEGEEPEVEPPKRRFQRKERPKREPRKKRKEKDEDSSYKLPKDPDREKRKVKFILAGVLIVALLLGFFYGPQRLVGKITNILGTEEQTVSQTNTTEQNSSKTEQEPGDAVSGDLSNMRVIQVTTNMVMGDQITEESIQEASISAESYNLITLSDNQVYQWDRHESLIGSYVSEYVPAGQFLTYANVSSTPPRLPSNPWIIDENIYTDIPIASDMLENGNLNFGAIMNLKIEKESVTETKVNKQDSEETVPGMEHESSVQQSYIVDTYTLSDIVLCDLINAYGESLYNYYAKYLSIPVGERTDYIEMQLKNDPELKERLTPVYITICVSKEQMNKLGDLSSDGVTITISFTGQNDDSPSEKKTFIDDSIILRQTITELLDKISAEGEVSDVEEEG